MNKTNNQEFVSKLKKTYSTLAQATNLIIAEEGIPRADKGGWLDSSEHMYQLYKKHLINAKECGAKAGCFNQHGDKGYKYLTGGAENSFNDPVSPYRRLILNDGVQVNFEFLSSSCSYNWLDTDLCGLIRVDLNGEKGPNTYGRDAFSFKVTEKGLYPVGCQDINYCQTDNRTCACKVLRENAMNY